MTAPVTSPRTVGKGATVARHVGALENLSAADRRALLERGADSDESLRTRTGGILRRVRTGGDAALRELARELDDATLEGLEVPRASWDRALSTLAPELVQSLERAVENIRTVHRAFLPMASEVSPEPGVVVGRRPDPLRRVGVYAPGGRAAYPSSLLMGAIPARVAGVQEVIVCSPPVRGGTEPSPVVLAAAALAGVDRVFCIGGAGAIAAMAYGSESVPRVDRIVGPGNAWVAEAKLQVSRTVAIDSPAGPSELLLLALDGADAAAAARELMAQAEHDPEARVILLAAGEDVVRCVEHELRARVPATGRRSVIESSLSTHGALLWCGDETAMLDFARSYAAEHVLVAGADAVEVERVAAAVRNAGTVFVGESSSNSFGDYMTGANHVLPTGGLARSWSGLSVLDFMRWTTWQRVDAAAAARLAEPVGVLADAEGLPAHAAAARAWAAPDPATRRDGGRARAGARSSLSLARREVRDTLPYSAGDAGCAVDLSDNTNLWGTPPAALRALSALGDPSLESVRRYPAAYEGTLAAAVREHVGLPDCGVVTGCGSDDVLDAAMRAFGAPGARIAFSVPTFSMIPAFARVNGLRAVPIPLRDDWTVDADALVRTSAEIIYVCGPNNPTSTSVGREVLEEILARAPGLVILDEAYAEFADESHVSLAGRWPRLLVTRTFSKAFGLAGLRVGYGVGDEELTGLVQRARGPYKVSAAAEAAAVAALAPGAEGREWVFARVSDAVASRGRLVTELRARGLNCAPAEGNFVFVPTRRAGVLARALQARGILVRLHDGLTTGPVALRAAGGSALRIGVGPWPVMVQLLAALDEALATMSVDAGEVRP